MEQREEEQVLKPELIGLVIALGRFFMNCDGETDDRERSFVEQYVAQMIESGETTADDLQRVQSSVPATLTLPYLIAQTQQMAAQVSETERNSMLHALSYFIDRVIKANDVIHPNEADFYAQWKAAVGIDDNIDIEQFIR